MDPATIMGNIRFYGFTPSEVSTLEAIFKRLAQQVVVHFFLLLIVLIMLGLMYLRR